MSSASREDLARRLEAHPFLRGAPPEVIRRLASIARDASFAPGSALLREGADADTLFLVEDGLVALEIGIPGKGAARVESLRGGDIAGLSWLFPPHRWHLDAKAIEPTSAIALDALRLREWMDADPEIARVLATRLVRQLYERLERVRMQRLDVYRTET